jgi:hypothetical protein
MAAFLKMANAMKKANAEKQSSPTSSNEDKKSVLGNKLGDMLKKNKGASLMGQYCNLFYIYKFSNGYFQLKKYIQPDQFFTLKILFVPVVTS